MLSKQVKEEMEFNMNKIKENVLLIYIILIGIVLGILIASFIAFYITFQGKETIAPGTYIKSVNVSGKTQKEAKAEVEKFLKENMSDSLVFKYSNYEYNVEIEQFEAKFDVDSAVKYAYNIGRKRGFFGNTKDYISVLMNKIDIDPVLKYDKNALDDYIDFLEISLPDQVEEPGFYIDKGKLKITTGKTGVRNL